MNENMEFCEYFKVINDKTGKTEHWGTECGKPIYRKTGVKKWSGIVKCVGCGKIINVNENKKVKVSDFGYQFDESSKDATKKAQKLTPRLFINKKSITANITKVAAHKIPPGNFTDTLPTLDLNEFAIKMYKLGSSDMQFERIHTEDDIEWFNETIKNVIVECTKKRKYRYE